jgi:hypothetical protein
MRASPIDDVTHGVWKSRATSYEEAALRSVDPTIVASFQRLAKELRECQDQMEGDPSYAPPEKVKTDTSDDDILTRLLALNHERAGEQSKATTTTN